LNFRDWAGSTSPMPKCTEEQLTSMREVHMKWKLEPPKGSQVNSPDESEYLLAKKRYEEVERLMQADQISQVGLCEFRRFGVRFRSKAYKIEVIT